MSVEYWFSVPLFVHDFSIEKLDAIQQEIKNSIDSISTDKKTSPWGDSVETTFSKEHSVNDVEHYGLEVLHSAILEAVNSYCNNIKYPDPDFKLTESWFNFYQANDFQYDHTHPHSRLSGVYYYHASEKDGKIRFQNPNPYMQFGGFPSDRIPIDAVTYKPKTGRIILFPSWLVHRVNINETTGERISVAFNLQ
jgi:uncharacterized protein (TIGR02466 family)